MTDESRKELEEIRHFLRSNRDTLKPMFGVMFWELTAIEGKVSPEKIAEEGTSLTLSAANDEFHAELLATYTKLWISANDLNAASRFIAASLEMTADELLQTRQAYLEAMDQL